MKINWKVRFQNKTWLMAFLLAAISFVYQVLGLFGIAPAIGQDTLSEIIGMIINLLVMLGVVIDPTTEGTSDSARALTYTVPGGNKDAK